MLSMLVGAGTFKPTHLPYRAYIDSSCDWTHPVNRSRVPGIRPFSLQRSLQLGCAMPVLELHSSHQGDTQVFQASPLDLNGEQIFIVETNKAQEKAAFSVENFFEDLETESLGRTILTVPQLSSTQTFLYKHFSTFPDGTLCIADRQTSGKELEAQHDTGRGQNTWTSPEGCLMFSLYKKVKLPGQSLAEWPVKSESLYASERLPFVQYIVSLAIVQAIQQLFSTATEGKPPDVRIKWPNDIYAKGLKVGGILCQSVYREGLFHVIMGVGLNVTNEQPTTCISTLFQEGRSPLKISREVVLSAVINKLDNFLEVLQAEGFASLRESYLQCWLHSNQEIVLEEETSGTLAKIPMRVSGISDSGYLTAATSTGEEFELHPDGNSLDFFKGLVRHKKTLI